MSADKRKTILIAFAGLAVVLGAVIVVESPKFKSEDAIGAIGAVQKHRAPQITPQDVVLGDEQTKKQQQILYADFLADAAALQSASVAARAESASRAASQVRDLNSVLRARYFAAAAEQVAGMKALLARDEAAMSRLAAIDTEIAAAASKLRDSDIGQMQARLNGEFASLDAVLRSRDLKSVEADIASLGARINSTASLEAATNTLREASEAVASRTASMVRARQEYLDAMSKQASALRNAEEALSAGSRVRSDAAAEALASEANDLASRALVNMRNSLASDMAQVDSIARMQASVRSAQQSVESRAAGNTYQGAALRAFNTQAGSFVRDMDNLSARSQAQARSNMLGQADSASSYLGHAKQLDARVQSRAMVAECEAQLASVSQAARSNAAYASVLNSDALNSFSTHKSRNQ